jgi:glucan phosphoethanolaminetransferase (alkaline phosphatase superfamily)
VRERLAWLMDQRWFAWIVCGGLLILFVKGLAWTLNKIWNEAGWQYGAAACVVVFVISLISAAALDRRGNT